VADPSRYYVTTPIYYVNDRPHIGHAYCTILADVLARYHRMFGAQTHFVTGTDEHGQKVQEAAAARGVTPQAHCDEMHLAFKSLWPQLHVANDDFIRTTEPRHVKVVQAFLQKVYDAGDIYEQDYEGWYSVADEVFLTDKDVEDGRSKETGRPVQRIKERNYFFRMSKYAERLRQHILDNPRFIRPEHRANEVLGFLDTGLGDLCISRPKARLSWGIEIPFAPDYVTYVWFDALINYVSALDVLGDPQGFAQWWAAAHHLIGKDILTTHSVYWTTMLMALGLPLPQSITATGWWLSDNAKMSKTDGNVVSPLGMKDVYGPDVLRYFLVRDMVIGLDSNFTEEALIRRNNSDLANDLGNLARRAAGLVQRYFNGKVPAPGEPTDAEREIIALVADLEAAIPGYIDDLKVHQAIEETLQVVRRLNKYVTETAPFKTAKGDPVAAGRSLYTVLEGLRHAAWLLAPVMPAKMSELLVAIGADPEPGRLADLCWGGLPAGALLVEGDALFPRRDLPEAKEAPAPAPKPTHAPKAKAPKPPGREGAPTEIAFDDFLKVDLRVATVLEAARVAGSDKLLQLQVDLGAERRQIIAGIGKHFAPETLIGQQVTVVFNLAPRKIFGLQSQGMVVAADRPDGSLALMQPSAEVAPGTRVG
jgi:methionyl-tRNA synthetase